MNRFSSDVDVLDLRIPAQMSDALFCLANTAAVLVTISCSTPEIIAFFIPIIVAGGFLQVRTIVLNKGPANILPNVFFSKYF